MCAVFRVICDGVFYFTLQLSDPKHPPMMLQGHSEEVTSVAWCPTDFTKVRRKTFVSLLLFEFFKDSVSMIQRFLCFPAVKLSCFNRLGGWI